jgi:hypothetical protein
VHLQFTCSCWLGDARAFPVARTQGAFAGKVQDALSVLKKAGLLDNLDPAYNMTASLSDVAAQYPYGVRLKQLPSYYDKYLEVRFKLFKSHPTNEGLEQARKHRAVSTRRAVVSFRVCCIGSAPYKSPHPL